MDFARIKFEMSEKLFLFEVNRKEMLDSKANFYLVFLSTFIIIVVTGTNTVADIWKTLFSFTYIDIIAFVIPFVLA